MGVFVVERYLAGWPPDAMRSLVTRVDAAHTLLGIHGVRHVRSVLLLDEETCLCLFEGPDADSVRRANEVAGLPVDRVVAGEVLPA